ncbi:MAG: FCD domain-containing protein [Sphingomonadaceae bacterium]|nr:FCD domain-containing protein [Sphingomonadaceae bacterium]
MASGAKQVDEGKADSAVDTAAQSLREISLAKCESDFLGSEDDLVARLGVSKPTLRQASARVAQEHLIRVRRGVGGGYFARRPGSLSVSRMAAVYLRSRNASYVELTPLMPMFYGELARLASQNRDPEMISDLRQMAERDEHFVDEQDERGYMNFLRSERDFISFLAKMADNHVLELMVAITTDFSAHAQRNDKQMFRQLDNMAVYRKLRARFARAIANGDGDIAGLLSRRCTDLMCDWMLQGLENHSFQVDQIRCD